MKLTVPVNNNFYEESPILESSLGEVFAVKKSGIKKVQEIFSSVYELKLKSDQLKHVKIFSFKRTTHFKPDEERLILKMYSKEHGNHEKKYFVQTGLYAGTLYHKGCKINISTKYEDIFLKRMLNFINDIYVDNQKSSTKKDDSVNEFLYIIAYLFIQSLEKAAILGIPQVYHKVKGRSHKVKGTIDISEYLRSDVPFKGKLTSNYKEQFYVQEVVDILFLCLKKLERLFGKDIHNRLFVLYQILKQNYSGNFPSNEVIRNVKQHHSLNNPLYSSFRKVLEYAEIILLDIDLIPDDGDKKVETTGYLFDIAELFELYLEKLLKRKFGDWLINSQEEIKIYSRKFYGRKLIPDLVMRHKESNKVIVFDAKFKSMNFLNGDLDRNDLFQIHTYMGYFQKDLIAGGLLYPLSTDMSLEKAYSETLYGSENNQIKFIVDGIYVSDVISLDGLINKENEFIDRISVLINNIG